MVPDRSAGREAILKGDFHISDADPEALIDRDLSEWDILYAEGRDSTFHMKDSKFGFGYYTIGAMIMRNLQPTLRRLFDHLGLVSPDVLEQADVKVHRRIDATHRKIWEFNGKWGRWVLIILATLASLATLISPIGLDAVWLRMIILFPGIPAMFFLLSVVNPWNSNMRNQYMASSIDEHAIDEEHNRILVLVGEVHREAVGTHLRDLGWEVDSRPTESRAGRVVGRAHRFVSDILSSSGKSHMSRDN